MQRNLIWYTRISAIAIWFMFGTVVYFFLILPRGRSAKNNIGYVRFVGPTARRILGLNYIVRGQFQTDTNQPAVYIMNHQSALDVLSNFEFYPKNCIIVVKKALMAIPFFGWVIALGDNISVERTNRHQSMASMRKARTAIENKRYSVWIFPEGTRRNTAEIHHLKHGAFHLALQTKTPIIPVVTSAYCQTVNFNNIHSGTVIVEVLEPIPTADIGVEDIGKLIEKCHQVMSETLQRNTDEAMQRNSQNKDA